MKKAIYLFLLIFSFGDCCQAKNLGKQGQTWTISEEGVISMIKTRLGQVDIAKHQLLIAEKAKKSFEQPMNLGISQTLNNKQYLFDPSYVLERDIRGNNGNLIFAAGTKVNPLEHESLGEKILLIDGSRADNINLAKNLITQNKDTKYQVILVGGSPIKVAKELRQPVFFDQMRTWIQRFKIRSVPALLEQEDQMIKITEIVAK